MERQVIHEYRVTVTDDCEPFAEPESKIREMIAKCPTLADIDVRVELIKTTMGAKPDPTRHPSVVKDARENGGTV